MNISTVSQRDFVQLGRSMKNYIYAIIFAAVGAIIAVVSIVGSLFTAAFSFSSLPAINPLGLIIGLVVVVVVLAVLMLAFYIKMILDIGVVGRSTNDAHLLKAYNCFKWSILANFLGAALFAGIIGAVISVMLANPMSFGNLYGFSSTSTGIYTGNLYAYPYALMVLIYGVIGAGIVFDIVICILPIIGAIALHNWALEYTAGKNSRACKSMKDGSDLIKLGYILSWIPGIGFIGSILLIVGLWQTGSGLINEFSGEMTPGTTGPSAPATMPQGGTTTQAGFGVPSPSSTIEESPATQGRFCPHCGNQVEASSARFCQSCGMPLY